MKALIAALLVLPLPVMGQGAQCMDRAEVVAQLAARYGEELRAIGMAGESRVVEIFAAGPGGSWTILITSADGMSCVVAAGQMFEGFEAPRRPAGDPA